MCNQAVELHFQSFLLLYTGRKGWAEASSTSNGGNLMSSC